MTIRLIASCVVLWVGLIAAGCAGTLEECDDMGRCTQIERFVGQVDETSTLTILTTIPAYESGYDCISLGSADETGMVLIKPRIQQFSAVQGFIVSARSPYMGHMEGSIDVYAVVAQNGVTAPPFPILDIVAFKEIPPFRPERAVMSRHLATTTDGSGNLSATFRVTGRKRISVTVAQAATGDTVTVSAARRGWISATSGFNAIVDTKSATGARLNYEFSTAALYSAAAVPPPGVSVIDYVAVALSSQTASSAVDIDVQAWDE